MARSRLEAFSDGVFAIVITLLVLDLKGPVEGQSIVRALSDQKYTIAAYVVAFLVVGVLWINHHGVFRFAARIDRTLTFVNLVFLLLLAATPFTASLFADGLRRGHFDAKVAAALFSAMFLGMALLYGLQGSWCRGPEPCTRTSIQWLPGTRRDASGWATSSMPR